MKPGKLLFLLGCAACALLICMVVTSTRDPPHALPAMPGHSAQRVLPDQCVLTALAPRNSVPWQQENRQALFCLLFVNGMPSAEIWEVADGSTVAALSARTQETAQDCRDPVDTAALLSKIYFLRP